MSTHPFPSERRKQTMFTRTPKKRQKDIGWVSPEERAASLLSVAIAEGDGADDDHITILDKDLQEKKRREQKEKETAEGNKAAEQAVAIAPRFERQKLRVLIVTAETAVFARGGAVETEYAALGEYLDELHIIVRTLRREDAYVSRRIASNVWVYPTDSRSALVSLYDTYVLANRQLAFAAGFRADVVVATDPFETGVAAYSIALRHGRPLQLQVSTDPFESDFLAEHPGNKWRLLAAKFVIPRADCLFVRGERMETLLVRRYPEHAGRITVLPPFHHLASFRDAVPAFNLHERYPQFKFVILVISRLDADSRVELAIDVCAPLVQQYPTIGLVVVGDGPLRARLAKKVLAANLQNKIVFEPETDDLVSYMKTANLFLNVSADEEHDMLLAASAAAGLPVLTVAGEMASVLFKDGVNAFVCPENDMVCLQARIGEFLNDNQLRIAFSINARDTVFSALDQDVAAYREKLVGSFASCVVEIYSEET